MTEPTGRRRAPGMSPEQRREMVIRAALPLVAEFGTKVTTAQVARAAGIGEATIFRVFPDKEALLDACVAETLDPSNVLRELGSIPLDQPLAARLAEAEDAMRAHLDRMGAVIGALHASGHHRHRPRGGRPAPDAGAAGAPTSAETPSAATPGAGFRPPRGADGPPASGAAGAPTFAATPASAEAGFRPPRGADGPPASGAAGAPNADDPDRFDRLASYRATRDALAELFEPDRAALRLPPVQLADLFMRIVVLPRHHPAGDSAAFDRDALVDVFLHGALQTKGTVQ